MADGLSVTTANALLTTLVTAPSASFIQLHTGPPGASGTANVSSVATRESVTWAGPAAGSVTASNQPAWLSWAGTSPETDTDISFWTASTSGAFTMSAVLSPAVTLNTGDSLTLTSVSVTIPVAS